MFDKLSDTFALPDDAVKRPEADSETEFRCRSFRTDVVLPWLMQTYQNLKNHGNHDGTASKILTTSSMMHQYALLSMQGWSTAAGTNYDFELTGKVGPNDVIIPVRGGAIDIGQVLNYFPFLDEARQGVMAKRPELVLLGLGDSSVAEWAYVFYGFAIDKLGKKFGDVFQAFARSIMPSMFKAIAVGADLYMAYVYLQNVSGSELSQPPQRLRTQTGRRGRMDQLTLGWTIREMNRVAGSTTTIADCVSGNTKVDQLITHASISELFANNRTCMRNTEQVSMVWDPGSYSGHQYNVSYLMDVEIRIATATPVKVTAEPKHLCYLALLHIETARCILVRYFRSTK